MKASDSLPLPDKQQLLQYHLLYPTSSSSSSTSKVYLQDRFIARRPMTTEPLATHFQFNMPATPSEVPSVYLQNLTHLFTGSTLDKPAPINQFTIKENPVAS